MNVALLPGFGQYAKAYAAWRDLLPFPVSIFDLPGYGSEPLGGRYGLAELADLYEHRLAPDTVVVGESLGGLIALELATRGRSVVVVEPPLSTAKLWPLHFSFRQMIDRRSHIPLHPLIEAVFGVVESGGTLERNYWPVLDRLPAPVEIVAADLPLWPIRQSEEVPSVLDEVDADRLARHPQVMFRRIAGEHSLMTRNVEAVRPVLVQAIAEADAFRTRPLRS
jgi:pimeloyl-ACP methyl ester carboxylesterase